MKTLDVVVFIPLIPAIPVIATWFLPWEKWIPARVPTRVLGPYLLYCAFGTWYFKEPWWCVTIILGLAVFACGGAVVEWMAREK
jgi:hypothetical protein